MPRSTAVSHAQVVLPVDELDPTLNYFTKTLGFRVDAIFPADAPTTAVLSGHGLTIRLEPGDTGSAGHLRLASSETAELDGGASSLVAPNGTRIDLVDPGAKPKLPPISQSRVVSHLASDSAWGAGRAGMQYRDIIPGRQGGRFIGSHIRIPGGGPVPDYVHHHHVRFQIIYCHHGWARLVYEDQGEPFVLRAGDCVLQPPHIRHRVLESGDGLEVVELGCPAEHETLADHDLDLPTDKVHPDRDFDGQRFVRHVASSATWVPWRFEGFECRDTGIGAATNGLAGVRVVRSVDAETTPRWVHDAEFVFGFVLQGHMALECDGHPPADLAEGDTFVVPAGLAHSWSACSSDLEVLDVTLPDRLEVQLRSER